MTTEGAKSIACAILFCGCAAAALYSRQHDMEYGWWLAGCVIAFLCA